MVVDLIRFQRVSGSSWPCSCFCFSHSSAVASEIEWIATSFDMFRSFSLSPCFSQFFSSFHSFPSCGEKTTPEVGLSLSQ